jgi:large subunit ribosomal protein L21
MYAVISTGGKQYKLNQGDVVDIERVEGDVGEKIVFDNVLCMGKEENLQVGSPIVDGAKVVGTILEQAKGEKITVFKFKRRKMYRRKQGHRQLLTKVRIESIEGLEVSEPKPKPKKKAAAKKDSKSTKTAKSKNKEMVKAEAKDKESKPEAKPETKKKAAEKQQEE